MIKVIELNGEEWLHYSNIDVNVALIRGTTADENGNITTEHEAANFEIYRWQRQSETMAVLSSHK